MLDGNKQLKTAVGYKVCVLVCVCVCVDHFLFSIAEMLSKADMLHCHNSTGGVTDHIDRHYHWSLCVR